MKAAIYARYSTDKQTELSIEAQYRACREYALKEGYEIVKEYADEAISGKSTISRAAYQRMMRDAKQQKFDAILIHKYDRIARNLGDHVNLANRLDEYGIRLIAVAQDYGEGKEAKLMRSMQWILSEYYIDNLAEEARKGLKEIALKGLHTGGVAPFGYKVIDGKYEIVEEEAVWVRRMFDACIHRKGYTNLLKEMEDAGVVGHRGKPLREPSIHEILHNEKYTGTYLYSPIEEKTRANRRTKPNAIRIEDAFPAIVDHSTFQEAQKVMKDRKHKKKTHYWCSGLVWCGECGSPMYPSTMTKGAHTYQRYCCSKHCGNHTALVEKVDAAVDIYLDLLFTAENKKKMSRMMVEYSRNEAAYKKSFEEEKKKKIADIDTKVANLMQNMSSGVLPAEVIQAISQQIESLLKEKKTIADSKPVIVSVPEVYEGWIEKLLVAHREDLPRLLVKRIEIKNGSAIIKSNFAEFVRSHGCGGTQPSLPTIMLYYIHTM